MKCIAITGTDGFIGQAVVPELVAAGHRILAVSRSARPIAGAEVRPIADLTDADWSSALRGADTVVHLAGRAHVMREREADALTAYRRINATATEALARAAAAAGVRRFVFASTIKVMGEFSPRPFVESDTPRPADAYGISKLEAERSLADIGAATGLEVVILRPPLVYGPGVKANFLALMNAVARGLPLPLGAARQPRSFIHVRNLSVAFRLAVESPRAVGQCYVVRDGEDISMAELIVRLAVALGRRARLVPVPEPMMRLAGRLTGTSDRIARLFDALAVDDSKIRRELGFVPPVSLARGLTETAAWFRERRAAEQSATGA